MFKGFLLGLILSLSSLPLSASIDRAASYYSKGKGSSQYYPEIALELARDQFYFTAVPFIKEYLLFSKKKISSRVDNIIDKVIVRVGAKQFEVLPIGILKKSNAPSIRYIMAKKYFREKKYQKALELLKGSIVRKHPFSPYALLLKGSIYSITEKYPRAISTYEDCVSNAGDRVSDTKGNIQRQLQITKENCIVGISRAQFAAGQYDKANSTYLDLPKESHIWPEILFEEAWNSFYQRDYNRTLGKLVTYKAPILGHIFNPEIETLKALTYLELCLWDDAKKTVDGFYSEYSKEHQELGRILDQYKKDYKVFYKLGKMRLKEPVKGPELLNNILKAIVRDPTYIDLYSSFQRGGKELARLKALGTRRFTALMGRNLKEALVLQRNLVGAYVRHSIHIYYGLLNKTFEGMSYIKLEMLGRQKSEVFDGGKEEDAGKERGRGSVKNLKRNEKQYFWTFNGEFWADELGDYVFALKSECE